MFTKLLVPLDGSLLAEQAVTTAAAIARESGAAVDLILVHQKLRALGVSASPEMEAHQWRDDDRYLEALAEEIRSGAGVPVTHVVPTGDPVEMICARALDESADLVVMTSHGRTGFSRLWLGSTADGVVRRSTVPVLLLRPQEAVPRARRARTGLGRIVVPLDGSAFAEEVIPVAAELARAQDGHLLLLRVVRPVPMSVSGPATAWSGAVAIEDEAATKLLAHEARQDLARVVQMLADRGITGAEPHVVVEPGVAAAITAFAAAQRANAIALSTHGRGASRLVVGSVADKVLRGTDLAVILRRPAGVGAERDPLAGAAIEEQLVAVTGG